MADPSRSRDEQVGVDDRCGLFVFFGQPFIGEVDIQAGGVERTVPGLGLYRLEFHARFAEPGEASVA